MKILNDQEHRIFLAAMRRERKVCGSEDFFDYDGTNKLLDICDRIERKVNDAELVRHGRWITYRLNDCSKCSCCEELTFMESNYLYCPNCSARMEE